MHSKVHDKHARTRGQLGGLKCMQRERATREAMLPTGTSCTSPTKIFTWASLRCRPAPYVERQPWQVVSRTAQAHRRHSTWTQACAAQAHTAMRAAHTRRTRACTTLTCAHQRRGGRARGGEQGRQQALRRHKGRWGTCARLDIEITRIESIWRSSQEVDGH